MIKKSLADLPLFIEAARQKSFSRAAEALNMPLPSVSRKIAALEAALGVRLFHRTTRVVELTDAGQQFFERAEAALAELDAAREDIIKAESGITGRIRLAMHEEIYLRALSGGVLSDFAKAHPGITLHVIFTNRWVDLNTEPFDLYIRIGDLPDSTFKARKLAQFSPGLYCSPSLLEKHPAPKTPKEVSTLPAVWFPFPAPLLLNLTNGKRNEAVRVSPMHTAGNVRLALEMILAGLGVGLLDKQSASIHVENGDLIRLLPEWQGVTATITAVTPAGRSPKRVSLFVEYLSGHFKRLAKELDGEYEQAATSPHGKTEASVFSK